MNSKNVLKGSIISAVVMTAVFAFAGVASAITPTTWAVNNDAAANCSDVTGTPFCTIGAAVAASVDGDTISIAAGTSYAENVTVNKSLTITGSGSANMNATGNTSVFTITAANVTIANMNFVKSDNADQNLITISANGAQIENNHFTGTYTLGGNGVTRAMVVSPGVTGLDIGNNVISHLRQPCLHGCFYRICS